MALWTWPWKAGCWLPTLVTPSRWFASAWQLRIAAIGGRQSCGTLPPLELAPTRPGTGWTSKLDDQLGLAIRGRLRAYSCPPLRKRRQPCATTATRWTRRLRAVRIVERAYECSGCGATPSRSLAGRRLRWLRHCRARLHIARPFERLHHRPNVPQPERQTAAYRPRSTCTAQCCAARSMIAPSLARSAEPPVVSPQPCPAPGSASTSRQKWRGANPRRSRALSMA